MLCQPVADKKNELHIVLESHFGIYLFCHQMLGYSRILLNILISTVITNIIQTETFRLHMTTATVNRYAINDTKSPASKLIKICIDQMPTTVTQE